MQNVVAPSLTSRLAKHKMAERWAEVACCMRVLTMSNNMDVSTSVELVSRWRVSLGRVEQAKVRRKPSGRQSCTYRL